MQMIETLGRAAKFILVDGSAVLFKPLEISGKWIIGTDDENFPRVLHTQEIECVIRFETGNRNF